MATGKENPSWRTHYSQALAKLDADLSELGRWVSGYRYCPSRGGWLQWARGCKFSGMSAEIQQAMPLHWAWQPAGCKCQAGYSASCLGPSCCKCLLNTVATQALNLVPCLLDHKTSGKLVHWHTLGSHPQNLSVGLRHGSNPRAKLSNMPDRIRTS